MRARACVCGYVSDMVRWFSNNNIIHTSICYNRKNMCFFRLETTPTITLLLHFNFIKFLLISHNTNSHLQWNWLKPKQKCKEIYFFLTHCIFYVIFDFVPARTLSITIYNYWGHLRKNFLSNWYLWILPTLYYMIFYMNIGKFIIHCNNIIKIVRRLQLTFTGARDSTTLQMENRQMRCALLTRFKCLRWTLTFLFNSCIWR